MEAVRLLDRTRRRLLIEARDNKVQYLVLVFFLVAGIAAGTFTVRNMQSAAKTEINNYINILFVTIKTNSIDYFSILVNSFLQNSVLFAIITMSSLVMIGIPVIAITMLTKGFFVGFTVGVLAFNIGAGGFAAIVFCTFLPNIVLIPCILKAGTLGINNAIAVVKKRRIPRTTRDRLIESKPHLRKVFGIYLMAWVGVALETFLTPILIKLI